MKGQAELDAFVEELRASHWGLRAPLRYAAIRQLLKDQHIPVTIAPMPVPAMTTIQWGMAAIALNGALRQSSQVAVLAEEYAHAMLHREEPGELTIHLSAFGAQDAREYEADYVARSLLAGPGIEVAYFTPPKKKPASKPEIPAWWLDPRFDPYMNPYRVGPGQWPLHALEARGPHRRRRVAKDKLLPGEPAIVYGQLFGPPHYRDPDGVKWELHDATVDMKDGTIVRVEVELGSARALFRYFVGPSERRSYRFARWEQRDVKVKHLERQMRESKVLAKSATRQANSA